MNINLLKRGILTVNAKGIGGVSREMLQNRAGELALINGRAEKDVSKNDLEQAKRELTGDPEMDTQEALRETSTESECWDPLPGSPGHRAPVFTSDDEDSEGRSVGEALVEEGVREAEHDQMLQAAKVQQEDM